MVSVRLVRTSASALIPLVRFPRLSDLRCYICHMQPADDDLVSPKMPELTADSEEGFVDLSLKMNGLVREPEGTFRFEARATHEGRQV
jgi:hypothetical protein